MQLYAGTIMARTLPPPAHHSFKPSDAEERTVLCTQHGIVATKERLYHHLSPLKAALVAYHALRPLTTTRHVHE